MEGGGGVGGGGGGGGGGGSQYSQQTWQEVLENSNVSLIGYGVMQGCS